MSINLDELKAFEAVCSEGNISQAARRLGVTQPSLSWTIRKLEEVVGCQLFHRSKKGVVLSRAGELFRTRARVLHRNWEQLLTGLHNETQEPAGIYTLGIHPTMAYFTLPKFVPNLLRQYPKVDLKPVHDLSRNIIEGVIQFRYDYGLVVNAPQHPDLTIVDLYQDDILLWTLAEPTPLQDPNNLASVIICNPDLAQTQSILANAFRSGLVKSERVFYTKELMVIAALTAAGAGIGLMPKTLIHGQPGEKLVALKGSPLAHDQVSLIWRGEAQKSVAAKAIRQEIISALKEQ